MTSERRMKNRKLFTSDNNWMFELILLSYFESGDLTDADLELSRDELLEKVFDHICDNGIKFVTDYRDSILQHANYFQKSNEYEFAIMFFAMYFEHHLNSIICRSCELKEFSETEIKDLIKNVNIQGKLTWLPKLFGHRPINPTHRKTILLLAENRNAFVHYKWQDGEVLTKSKAMIATPDKVEKEVERRQQFLLKIKAAVKYLKLYESTLLYNKNKARIKNALK